MRKLFILFALLIFGLTTAYVIGCQSDSLEKPAAQDPTTPIPIPDDEKNPDRPRNVTAQAGNAQAFMSWDPVFSATGYRIYQSEDGVTFIRLTSTANITENSATIVGLQNGNVYYFGVTAVDERKNESGISYVGGSPTAVKIIPSEPAGPPPPPPPPVPPEDFEFIAGDRSAMVTWTYPTPDNIEGFTLDRSMNINPFANLPGDSALERELIRQAFMNIYAQRFPLDLVFDDYEVGERVNGFTIPATPYWIDRGRSYVGLPPNYLPFGLVDGDVTYNYKVGAWNSWEYGAYGTEYYSAFAVLEDVIPLDSPPSPPELLAALMVENTSGDGVGVFLEWTQPSPPENSDIRNYVLLRETLGNGLSISKIISSPFNIGISSITYQDDSVVAGEGYKYTVFAQDYKAQASAGSNSIAINIPAPPEPPEEEEE